MGSRLCVLAWGERGVDVFVGGAWVLFLCLYLAGRIGVFCDEAGLAGYEACSLSQLEHRSAELQATTKSKVEEIRIPGWTLQGRLVLYIPGDTLSG